MSLIGLTSIFLGHRIPEFPYTYGDMDEESRDSEDKSPGFSLIGGSGSSTTSTQLWQLQKGQVGRKQPVVFFRVKRLLDINCHA